MAFIDASKEDNSFGRLFNDNHETPNVHVKPVQVDGLMYPCYFASRNIKPFEELEYNCGGPEDSYFWTVSGNNLLFQFFQLYPNICKIGIGIGIENDQEVTKEVISKGKLVDSDSQSLHFEDENNKPTWENLEEVMQKPIASNSTSRDLIFKMKKNEPQIDSQTGMTKKTAKPKPKPKRPCLYCKKKFTNVSQHMKRIHADETDVEKILTFPKKDQDSEMHKLLKRGVQSHSPDLFESNKNAEVMIMRKEKIENEVVICESCLGTYGKSKFYLHEKTCNGGLKIVVERKSIVGEFSEKYFEEITTYSEVIKLCRKNPINLQYGKHVLNSSIAHPSNEVVEETIYAIIEKKKVVQRSIMLHLQEIINLLINSMTLIYIVERQETKQKLLLGFKEVFKHRSKLIFNASQCHSVW
ncbi:hypothetical protein Anas_13356 [Armadillidium nasatum]|uniref:SET domain-containing protein n=1 Tax=Armadillidium nasatum TaxID=96803 RepID=A0A5N5T5J9_9CRUS|nr:hypothetical protein Anas_13356 [Armadillidium nasatum]